MKTLSILRYITYGIITIILIIIITIIFIVLVSLIFSPDTPEQTGSSEDCIEMKDITSLKYKSCYDAFSKNIFFEIKNNNLIHNGAKIELSFFDYNPRKYEFNVPNYNTSLYQKIPAQRRPYFLEVFLKDNTIELCRDSDNVPIGYHVPIDFCPAELANKTNVSINLVTQSSASEFIVTSVSTSDQLPIDLVKTDKAWESVCKSEWQCDSWQTSCTDNLQKRECIDLSECQIPTQVPQRVKSCDVTCVEDWQCEWSECTNGQTNPSCSDLSNCGTTANKPTTISCAKKCTPDISCSEWNSCSANYDFLTLIGTDYTLSGQQQRFCTDKTSCVPPTLESRDCSLAVDIYTTSFVKCGKEYIGIYNQLNNQLLGNIEKSKNRNQLNIDLSEGAATTYCDYCFDGILNGDEDQIDCGGSCASCETRKVDIEYSKNIIEKFLDRIFGFFE